MTLYIGLMNYAVHAQHRVGSNFVELKLYADLSSYLHLFQNITFPYTFKMDRTHLVIPYFESFMLLILLEIVVYYSWEIFRNKQKENLRNLLQECF